MNLTPNEPCVRTVLTPYILIIHVVCFKVIVYLRIVLCVASPWILHHLRFIPHAYHI